MSAEKAYEILSRGLENVNIGARHYPAQAGRLGGNFEIQLSVKGGQFKNKILYDHFQVISDGARLDHREKGEGRTIAANFAQLRLVLGAYDNRIRANEVGAYLWPKLGYTVAESNIVDLREGIELRVDALKHAELINRETVANIEKIVASCDPKFIWAIADLDQEIKKQNGEKIKVGKYLLLDQSYPAFQDLRDPEVRDRIEKYVKIKLDVPKRGTIPNCPPLDRNLGNTRIINLGSENYIG